MSNLKVSRKCPRGRRRHSQAATGEKPRRAVRPRPDDALSSAQPGRGRSINRSTARVHAMPLPRGSPDDSVINPVCVPPRGAGGPEPALLL